jgi:hypothetical protein
LPIAAIGVSSKIRYRVGWDLRDLCSLVQESTTFEVFGRCARQTAARIGTPMLSFCVNKFAVVRVV